jgi:hypothetical protein
VDIMAQAECRRVLQFSIQVLSGGVGGDEGGDREVVDGARLAAAGLVDLLRSGGLGGGGGTGEAEACWPRLAARWRRCPPAGLSS